MRYYSPHHLPSVRAGPPASGQTWPQVLLGLLRFKRSMATCGQRCPACGQSSQAIEKHRKLKLRTKRTIPPSGQPVAIGREDGVQRCPDSLQPVAKAGGFLRWLVAIGDAGPKSSSWLEIAYQVYCQDENLEPLHINTVRRDLVRLGVTKKVKDIIREPGRRKRQTFYDIQPLTKKKTGSVIKFRRAA